MDAAPLAWEICLTGPVSQRLADELATKQTAPASHVRYWVFALCCGSSWMLNLHRSAFAVIKPKLQDEWGLSETDLGLLDSAFSSAYAFCQFPAGVATDLLGAHWFLGTAIVAWSLMMGLQAWAPTIAVLSWVRVIFGAAQSGALSALAKITRSWFPVSVRTSVQGWVGIFFSRAGVATTNLVMASLMIGIFELDWRTAVYLLAGAGMALGVLFLLVFRNTPQQHPWVNQAEAELISGDAAGQCAAVRLTVGETFRTLSPRGIVNLLSLNLQTFFSAAADVIYTAWIPLYLYNVHHLQYTEMGVYSALPLIGGAIGGAVGGWLNDRFRRRSARWGRAGVGIVGKGGAALLLLAALLGESNPYFFCGMLFLVKLVGDWSLASTWGTVTDIGGQASATVFGINNAVGNVGTIVAPIVYGYMAEHYGWGPVFYTVVGVYFLCAAMWLVVDCTRPLIEHEQRP